MRSASPEGRARSPLRSIFLSDVHLGSRRAQAELLLDFLAHHEAEFVFLVGDIAEESRPREAWPEPHRAALGALADCARRGSRVHYLSGNHDPHFAERWKDAAALRIAREHQHETADGRRLLVLHGDAFDGLVRRRRLTRLSDGLARGLERGSRALERLARLRPGRLGLALKERAKAWVGYTRRFERSALAAARARALDGIVCGHVHSAASCVREGLYYGNGGDWVGSATALVEHPDGRMELVSWRPAA